jgi:glycogen phosphorylase
VNRTRDGDRLRVEAQVFIDELAPDAVRVELYADPQQPDAAPERIPLERGEALAGAAGGWRWHAEIDIRRPAEHYSLRVVPDHPLLSWPLESALVCWEG